VLGCLAHNKSDSMENVQYGIQKLFSQVIAGLSVLSGLLVTASTNPVSEANASFRQRQHST